MTISTQRGKGRKPGWAVALAGALALTGCTTGSDDALPSVPSPSPTSETVSPVPSEASGSLVVHATGLTAPWSIAFTEQDVALVSERDSGRILELAGDGTPREAGVVEGVAARGEGGLLGITVHDGRLYAYSTGTDGNRIERFDLTGRPGSLGLGSGETILSGLPAAATHNGGRIAFGPDGMLYVTVGDAGDRARAQDIETLAGKILRLEPDGRVPADNPFPGSPVYSYGHRNPQGLAWDDAGVLYATEFGQNTWDELNVIEAGGNYGWPMVEGIAGRDGFIDPLQQWSPAEASPSGMAIVDGRIHIANLRGARLRSIPLEDPATAEELLVGEYGRLRDAVAAPDGSLWVVTNNTDGRGDPAPDDDRILRLVP
ncbi:PQQ-dependent sugar dehydrogenase [Microbacterium caowuchunii]|uniref:PQQ-dependent sugar dehydrogenase n=1 Tax=Microbacterium caowuchunii TaxID=2614638 RepID=UPI001243DF12|nr:PQQ-dependent sugar dehydrogenase [Microbacterium caowuchunii]QEW00113.1 PQQ-dependent sugar dehydrogenase [Microbacterium caowuchunii]